MRKNQMFVNFDRLLIRSCLGTLLCCIVACGGGSSPTEPPGGYKPGWKQQFANAGFTRTYNFDAGADDGKEAGNLTGFEIRNVFDQGALQGTFTNRDIRFSVDRDQDGTFEFPITGFWVDDNTIRLTSADGTVIVSRQPA